MRTRAEASIEVDVDPETAFRIFTEELDLWWVRGPINHYDSSRLAELRMEPGVGGRVLEVYADGTVSGREVITVWEPGSRLCLQGPDTQIDILFEPIASGCRIQVAQYLRPDGDPSKAGFGWANMLRTYDAWTRRRDHAPRVPREVDRLGLALHYEDPAAAARWLRRVFQLGDWDVDRAPAEGESPDWIEFHVGNASVMLFGAAGRDHNTWVYVDDLAAHYAQAKQHGAKIITGPRSHGSTTYQAEDLAGHRWTFVQARPTMRLGPGPFAELAEAVTGADGAAAQRLIGQVDPRSTSLLLHRFARAGDAAAIRLLLEAGAEVDGLDDTGATALHLAAAAGHLDCATALIDAGAELDLRDHEHASAPVRWARDSGQHAMVRLLLDRGARLNAADAAALGLEHVLAGFAADVPRSSASTRPTPISGP
ncbi:ankyrin repeat domain-containing protein [Microlunatus speluncae]|uniref:ankyrin repeat domain-containing protein n=1 Tax=Microlunatus speluncae TaxID=2594267 RepID=UPI0012668482|nr:ankyrin repeat domain-containing protein [Microlunatus speluncae]